MPDPTNTLAALIDEVKHNGLTSSSYPALHLASTSAHLTLSAQRTSNPAGKSLSLPSEAELKRLLDALLPPPPTDAPSAEAIRIALEEGATGSLSTLLLALSDLVRLPWLGIWQVLEQLAMRGPSMDGQTYLEILEGRVRDLPNVDQRVPAAMIVTLLQRGGRTLASDQVVTMARLGKALLGMDDWSQIEILRRLDIPPDAAEGTIALLEAEILELPEEDVPIQPRAVELAAATGGSWLAKLESLWARLDVNADTFLDWEKPGKMPYGAYIGISVHKEIAKFYEGVHSSHGRVMTNTWSVSSILADLEILYAFRGSPLQAALALSRPDIFELGLTHGMPPGWVYEIKPAGVGGAGIYRAEFEALFYAEAMTLCDIPVIPGPPLAPGTEGVVAVPHGWAAFVSPVPGVILYRMRRASRRAIEARQQVPVHSDVKVKVDKILREFGPLIAFAAVAAALLALLVEYGWILILA